MIISAHQQDSINKVQELFHQLDQEIASFKSATSLGCVNGCGRCCETPAVFVTVLEVLPLAYELWKNGQALAVLEDIRNDRKGWCVFYKPDALVAGKGRCTTYPWRPLICRLFGFSAKKDKYEKSELVTCSTMKEHCATEYDGASRRLTAGTLRAPLMSDYAMQVLTIDPALGKEQFPINQAIANAIEKINMVMREE
jgi:Fe-S-cluster containining protein